MTVASYSDISLDMPCVGGFNLKQVFGMRKSRVRHGLNARVEVVDLRGAGLMKSSIVQLVASLLILLASLAPTSLAQSSSTGAITGSTIDPSGAVVVGAEITATNDATGEVRTTVSTSSGVFLLPLLSPGSYTLKTSKAGFKEMVRTGVLVTVTETVRANLQLQIGK